MLHPSAIPDLLDSAIAATLEPEEPIGPVLRRKNVFSPASGPNLFDEERQRAALTKCGDPLVELNELIDWSIFRARLLDLYKKQEDVKSVGRKPIDPLLMFKTLILQRLYGLSDDATEFSIRDRASFQRFLGIHAGDGSPDAKTIWLFRERLGEDDVARELFELFDAELLKRGVVAKGGQMIDASFIEVPRQSHTAEEKVYIEAGVRPPAWVENPHKDAQKDADATWAKKNKETHYGYKNTVNADVMNKVIRSFTVTTAAPHDSNMIGDVLLPHHEGSRVYADSAYRSAEIEAQLAELGLESQIHERAYRNTPLTEEQKASNTKKSKTRVRVEHVFAGIFARTYRGAHILCIGIKRARTVIGLENLTYNLRRFVALVTGRAKPLTIAT